MLDRRLNRVAGALLVAAACLPCAVRAASYRVPDDRTLVLKSTLVVRGRVIDRESKRLPDGAIVTDVKLSVEAVLRGASPGSILTVRQMGGIVDGVGFAVPGTGELAPGERAILLLRQDPGSPARVVDFALGTFHVGPTEDGQEAAWRADLLGEAAMAVGTTGPFRERLRDRALFERWIEDLSRGLARPADYFRDGWKPLALASAEFEMLKVNNMPALRAEFGAGQAVTVTDDSVGPAGAACNDFHGATALGVVAWDNIADATINIVYGGTDAAIGTKCFGNGALTDEINYDDPCNEIDNLAGCTGTLAIGGFSFNGGSTVFACPAKGPDFFKITSGAIVVNNGVGNCLNCCDFHDMIAHETGHTIGFGHSLDLSALMAPVIVLGRCGQVQADDILGAQCVYGAGAGCPKTVTSVLVVATKPTNVKLKVFGTSFNRFDHVQVDNGSGFQNVTTVLKSKTKIVGKHVETLFPPGTTVHVRVSGSCDSNAVDVSR